MERDVELRRNGHLYEIASVNDEMLGSRQGFPASETGYRKTVDSVLDISGPDLMDEVAASIKDHIRTHEERPANQAVRKDARHSSRRPGISPATTSTRRSSERSHAPNQSSRRRPGYHGPSPLSFFDLISYTENISVRCLILK